MTASTLQYRYTVHKELPCIDVNTEDLRSASTSFTHADLLPPDRALAIAEKNGDWEEDMDFISALEEDYMVEVECGSPGEDDYKYAELTSFLTHYDECIYPAKGFSDGVWIKKHSVFEIYEAFMGCDR